MDSFTEITFLMRPFFNALQMVKNTQPIHLMPLSRRGCFSQVVFHALIAVFLREEVSMMKVFFIVIRAEQRCDAAQPLPLMGREVHICVSVQIMMLPFSCSMKC